MIFTDFSEFHGDKTYADDKAIVGGFAYIDEQKYLIIGHQKGRDVKENIYRNFGSAHPEGYRKALRLMKLAEKFKIPIISIVDTPGAYPGVGAEERGQAYSIAYNLREMIQIKVPIMLIVIGEGGSGGALGIGIADRVSVLENAYYSVISPEGCAAILWKDHSKAPQAAASLKMVSKDLLSLGVIDNIIKEPMGGAHFDPEFTAKEIKKTIVSQTNELKDKSPEVLIKERYNKYRAMGVVQDVEEQKLTY
jgi:acetyl-CoA carboxylase carboxyl transferase subunit alpha